MLEVGMKAPDFTLQNQEGQSVSLSDFLGKRVVLYFYPKDNTPGCTRQACAFAGTYAEFEKKDVVVIGISRDSVASHTKFAQKYNLRTIVNHPNYCGKKGLTGKYQKLFNKPNVIQMEIKRELRDFYQYPEIVKNTTIPFLSEVINCYK